MASDDNKYFYFSDGSRRFGPYSREQVLTFLYQSRVGMMDQVFDSRSQEWTRLVNHVDFDMDETGKSEFVLGLTPQGANAVSELDLDPNALRAKAQGRPQAGAPPVVGPAVGPPKKAEDTPAKTASGEVPPPESTADAEEATNVGLTISIPQSPSETKSWFMKEGAITLGPYHYLTILAMIQDGTLRETDFLKQKGQKDWKKVEEIFSKADREQVGSLVPLRLDAVTPQRANLRNDMRKDINRVLLVSDDKVQYVMQGLDISTGGIAFASLAPHFQIGQILSCTLTHSTKNTLQVMGKVSRIQTIKSSNNEVDLLKYVLIFDEKIDPAIIADLEQQ